MPSGSNEKNKSRGLPDGLITPYKALVESANAAVFILQETKYIYANPAAEAMTGYPAEHLCSMDFTEILHPEDRDVVQNRAMARQHGDEVVSNYPIRILHRDGSVRHTSFSASVIDMNGKPAILGVSQDVTEMEERRRQAEEQLRQAQKMEAIGTLVGGIAHDINNSLAGITGNVHLARIFAGDAEKAVSKLDRIDQLSFRAAAMIRQLLAFARKDMVRMQRIDVRSFVGEVMARERMETPRRIKFKVESNGSVDLSIEGDSTQLQQVLLNLVQNACAAFDGVTGPHVRLQIEPFTADEAFVKVHDTPLGSEFVRISVLDNGCGMDEATIARIFEPFFT
ncbi:MAG: PAS domain S-box protein, partial [Mariprofundaceae bacterium]|nr:PAS domain S-box protein [Mariprofundaceae bacterium]